MISEKRIKQIRKLANGTLDVEGWGDSAVGDLLKAYDEQRKLLILLADTLSFYADPQTYFAIAFLPDRPNGDFMDDFSDCEDEYGDCFKPGKRAREAISKVEEIIK
jgi:hypothetical protein